MAAPVLATSATFADAGNATSRTINKPSGTASGDWLYLAVSIDGTATITTPTGFSLVFNEVEPAGSNMRLALFKRKADGTEGASFTIATSSEIASGIIVRVTGADATESLDVFSSWGGELNQTRSTGTLPTPEAYSLCTDGALVLQIASFDNGSGSFTATPSGYSSVAAVGTNSTGTHLSMYSKQMSAEGYVGPATWTFNNDIEQGWALTVVIRASASLATPAQPVIRCMNALHVLSSASTTLLKPHGTADGDLLLLHQTVRGTAGLTPPAAFTSIQSSSNGVAVTHQAYYRVASSEGTSYTVASASQDSLLTVMMRVAGADTSAPINTSSVATGTSNTPTASTITPSVNNCLLLFSQGSDDDEVTTNSGFPSGYSGVYAESNDTGTDCGMIIARKEQTTAAATGSAAGSFTASEEWVALHIAIAPTASGTQTVSPNGIASGAALGSPTITTGAVTASPNGIASGEGFGSATVTSRYTVSANGIASGEALGAPTVTPGVATVSPNGIAPTDGLGQPTVTPAAVSVSPQGIASGEAFGSATITPGVATISATGLASIAVLGSPTITPGGVSVSPSGIASGEALGEPSVTAAATIIATGIAPDAAFGSATITATASISPAGIGSGEGFGAPTISGTAGGQSVEPAGIASTTAFGSATVTAQATVATTGIAPGAAFGAPAVGATATLTADGITPTADFGSPTLTASAAIAATGIDSASAVGEPTITPGGVSFAATGIPSGEAFGQPTVTSLTASGLNVVRVPAEQRLVLVASQDRTVTVAAASRRVEVANDNRTVTVNPESRMIRVA